MSEINHVSVIAQDLETSLSFYERLFAAKRVAIGNFGYPVQWLQIGRMQLRVVERPALAPEFHHFAVSVDNFAELYARAEESRVIEHRSSGHHLFELPGDLLQLYLRDPAENLIEVDAGGAAEAPAAVRAAGVRLVDAYPQSPENLAASLPAPSVA